MLGAAVLLFQEYLFFKKKSDQLIELHDDYRQYVAAVNKILHDYNKTKEQLDILKSAENSDRAEEKKKEIDYVGLGFYTYQFPEHVHVVSSDDTPDDATLVVLNRDVDYLKDSIREYFKTRGNAAALSRISFNEWADYTQVTLSAGTAKKRVVTKKNSAPRRNRRVASYRGRQATQTSQTKKINLSWPIDRSNFWLSSLFGPRKKPNGSWGFHYGLDMAAMRGTEIHAALAGIVVEARFSRGYGNTIVIAHNRKYRTRYAHLDKMLVRVGQKVKHRQLIGKVGRTGLVWRSKGRDPSHLHFELHVFGKQVNPLKFLA